MAIRHVHGHAGDTVHVAAPAFQAYQILHFGFSILPIVAGLDKFAHYLVNWDMYLAPQFAAALPFDAHRFMLVVGCVEILAGILVAVRPSVGGKVVAVWLWAIIANLLAAGGYYDVVLRDFGLSLGALALAKLAEEPRT